MPPIYELWDIPTRNLVDAYDSEEAALEDVLYTLEHDGEWSVKALLLLRDDHNPDSKMFVAQGMDLAEYAKRVLTQRHS